jgi:hypothetical protein
MLLGSVECRDMRVWRRWSIVENVGRMVVVSQRQPVVVDVTLLVAGHGEKRWKRWQSEKEMISERKVRCRA